MADQKVVWVIQYDNGSQIAEFDQDGKETLFTEIIDQKMTFRFIALKDLVNDLTYSIDLHSGEFILNGLAVHPCKEMDGRMYGFEGHKIDFRSGVTQFKCSKPIEAFKPGVESVTASPRTFNIGYKVDLPESFCTYKAGQDIVSLIKCQAFISLNADSLKPSFSTTFTRQITLPDGKVIMQKI